MWLKMNNEDRKELSFLNAIIETKVSRITTAESVEFIKKDSLHALNLIKSKLTELINK